MAEERWRRLHEVVDELVGGDVSKEQALAILVDKLRTGSWEGRGISPAEHQPGLQPDYKPITEATWQLTKPREINPGLGILQCPGLTIVSIQVRPLTTETRPGKQANPDRNPGGRPAKYDWDAFWAEVVGYVGRVGLTKDQKGRRALTAHMINFTFPGAPSPQNPPNPKNKRAHVATVRKKIDFLFKTLGK